MGRKYSDKPEKAKFCRPLSREELDHFLGEYLPRMIQGVRCVMSEAWQSRTTENDGLERKLTEFKLDLIKETENKTLGLVCDAKSDIYIEGENGPVYNPEDKGPHYPFPHLRLGIVKSELTPEYRQFVDEIKEVTRQYRPGINTINAKGTPSIIKDLSEKIFDNETGNPVIETIIKNNYGNRLEESAQQLTDQEISREEHESYKAQVRREFLEKHQEEFELFQDVIGKNKSYQLLDVFISAYDSEQTQKDKGERQ